MCGLVGMYGNISPEDGVTFRDMLVNDSSRGKDSTGIYGVPREGEPFLHRELGPPWVFFQSVLFGEDAHHYDPFGAIETPMRLILGHNRAATVGDKNVANAHPFEFPSLVGAHNGTIFPHALNKLKYSKDFSVDSQVLFANFEERGVEDFYPEIDGAMAITMWWKETQRLNIFRNKDRPLVTLWKKDRSVVLWASEPWIADVALRCSAFRHDWDDDFKEVPVNTLHDFSFNEEKGEVEVETKALRPFVYTYTGSYRGPKDSQSESGKGSVVTLTGGRKNLMWFGDFDRHPACKLFLDSQYADWDCWMTPKFKLQRGEDGSLKFKEVRFTRFGNSWREQGVGYRQFGLGEMCMRLPKKMADTPDLDIDAICEHGEFRLVDDDWLKKAAPPHTISWLTMPAGLRTGETTNFSRVAWPDQWLEADWSYEDGQAYVVHNKVRWSLGPNLFDKLYWDNGSQKLYIISPITLGEQLPFKYEVQSFKDKNDPDFLRFLAVKRSQQNGPFGGTKEYIM